MPAPLSAVMEVRLTPAPTSDRHRAGTMLVSAVGQDVCLGFANTLAWRGREAPVEDSRGFRGSARVGPGVCRAPRASRSRARGLGPRAPSKAATVFAEAIALARSDLSHLQCPGLRRAGAQPRLCRAEPRRVESPARRQLARSGDGCAWQIELGKIGRTGLPAATLLCAGAVVGGRPHGRERAPTHSPLRQRCVPVAVRRREQERHAALVRHGLLRQPRQGAPALSEIKQG